MTPSDDCLTLLKGFEGCARRRWDGKFVAYPDPASGGAPWTIGWGSTGADITPSTIWTQDQCDARLARDIASFADQVWQLLNGSKTTQHQFDAMVDFAYNVGVKNFSASTLLARHKSGDYAGAAAQFARWNKAGGKVMPGLTKRRAAEAALYSKS